MNYFRRQILLQLFKVFDLAVMVFSFGLATAVVYYRFDLISFEHFLSLRISIKNFVIFSGLLILWRLIFSALGLYHSRRLPQNKSESIDILKATSLGTLALMGGALLFRIEMITLPFLFIFLLISSALTILGRLALRSFLKQLRMRGRNLRNLVIVGTNPRAVLFARNIQARPELGYRILGFVDDVWAKMQEFQQTGYEMIATLKDFPSFLRNNVVDEVAICLPVNSYYRQSSQIAAMCAEQGILARIPLIYST